MIRRRLVGIVAVAAAMSLLSMMFSACDGSSPAGDTSPAAAPAITEAPPQESTPEPTPKPAVTPAPAERPPVFADCDSPALEVRRGNSTRQMVALTFDAGSDAGYTSQILQTLSDAGVKASFSLTGEWSEAHPDLVQAMAAGGHLLMNHSYDHPSFTGLSTGEGPLSTQQRIDELDRADAVIRSITGQTTKPYFRPPYADFDGSVLCDVYADGYYYLVMWTVDTMGWNGATADEIVQTSLSRAKPGAIYIMHVGSQSQDAVALPRVIDGMRAQGYSFGTIADILR
ncbi:MAG: polysaccharide deacetylase family protein [Dehalococcoidia bacterium]|nr:polysaccharide deacetylase family protein [Dehalococcoidia bacterium]